jgi:hypothetical protein
MTNFEQKVGVRGRFMVEVIRADGTIDEVAPWQDNLVTDTGLGLFHGGGGCNLQNLHVGTGSTAPQFTDVILEGRVASIGISGVSYTSVVGAESYKKYSWVSTFAEGAVVGNIAELGVGATASAKYLFSRTLIKDVDGVPTVLTILSNEQLRVTYAIYLYVSSTPVETEVDINGTLHTFSTLPVYFGAWTPGQWYGFGTMTPNTIWSNNIYTPIAHGAYAFPYSLQSISGTTKPSSSYSVSDVVRYVTPSNNATEWKITFGLTGANYGGGIGGFTYGTMQTTINQGSFNVWYFQTSVTPAIMKDNTKSFSATVRISTERY